MTVSIDDVAEGAAVSRATVSRSFTRPELVNDATRQRVLTVADELGYRPQSRGRNGVDPRAGGALTRTLGLFVPDIANPFFPPFIKAIQSQARQRGYATVVVDSDEDAVSEVALVRALAERVDGLVLMSPRAPDQAVRELCEDHPVVVIHRHVHDVPHTVLVTDDGLVQGMQQLHTLGHRRVVYLAGPAHSYSNRVRARALRAAAKRMRTDLVELGPFEPRFEEGARAVDLVLAVGATAVFAYNDLIALGLMSELTRHGVKIGRDLSVVGIDDSWLARIAHPPLTTVHVPVEDTVRIALRMLTDGDGGADRSGSEVVSLPTRLVLRSTVGPVPLGHSGPGADAGAPVASRSGH